MTGPEHYREAEHWLAHAEGVYLDDSSDAGPREDYATDDEWMAALEESSELRERALREVAVFAALGQAHATLAQASAAALNDNNGGTSVRDYRAWKNVASVDGAAA